MSISPEEREANRLAYTISGALEESDMFQEISQRLQILTDRLNSIDCCLWKIEQNTHYDNREWRVIEVTPETLMPYSEDMFKEGWFLQHLIPVQNAEKHLVLIFWRRLEPRPEKPPAT